MSLQQNPYMKPAKVLTVEEENNSMQELSLSSKGLSFEENKTNDEEEAAEVLFFGTMHKANLDQRLWQSRNGLSWWPNVEQKMPFGAQKTNVLKTRAMQCSWQHWWMMMLSTGKWRPQNLPLQMQASASGRRILRWFGVHGQDCYGCKKDTKISTKRFPFEHLQTQKPTHKWLPLKSPSLNLLKWCWQCNKKTRQLWHQLSKQLAALISHSQVSLNQHQAGGHGSESSQLTWQACAARDEVRSISPSVAWHNWNHPWALPLQLWMKRFPPKGAWESGATRWGKNSQQHCKWCFRMLEVS